MAANCGMYVQRMRSPGDETPNICASEVSLFDLTGINEKVLAPCCTETSFPV